MAATLGVMALPSHTWAVVKKIQPCFTYLELKQLANFKSSEAKELME
jgi:hypothetical protein